jgi:hypothetical protein
MKGLNQSSASSLVSFYIEDKVDFSKSGSSIRLEISVYSTDLDNKPNFYLIL